MEKIVKLFVIIFIMGWIVSCNSTDDLKEISGTLIFNEIGSHSFTINAENIDATITIVGPNHGDTHIFEHVSLNRSSEYTAKIGQHTTSNIKTELLNNLVVMFEAKSGIVSSGNAQNTLENGYVKIDWRGYD